MKRKDSFVATLAALGLGDSLYLAMVHWWGEEPQCGAYAGCAQVNASSYAEIFGIPVAALGSALYLGILALAVWRLCAPTRRWWQLTVLLHELVLAAVVFMAYLTAVELLVLHAVCYWCLALAGISITLLLLLATDLFGSTSPNWRSRAG